MDSRCIAIIRHMQVECVREDRRQAVDWPRRLAAGECGVTHPRIVERRLGEQGYDRVDCWVYDLDAVEESDRELFGTQLALDEPAHQIASRGLDDFGVREQVVRHGVQGSMSGWVEAGSFIWRRPYRFRQCDDSRVR